MPLKAIPPGRDRLQSRALVAVTIPVLCVAAWHAAVSFPAMVPAITAPVISLLFALGAWRLKAATLAGAASGGLICLLLATAIPGAAYSLARSGLLPLFALFLSTFAATRFGRVRKEAHGTAESRRGRSASQVVANLAVAGLCASLHHGIPAFAAALAALAEATADTLSSEIGQAVAGPAYLLTTWRRVPAGSDGALSVSGTLAGLAGVALIVAVSLPTMLAIGGIHRSLAVFVAGVGGLLFDSLLGATVERRGWIGNDLVNFTSTVFAAVAAAALSGSGQPG